MLKQMSRWKPDARGRLEQAAYELFRDCGYEQTTVADIAERAELTERTFFRHFADKREVLFGGSAIVQGAMLQALEASSPALPPIEAVRNAVGAAARLMRGRRDLLRERSRIVAVHPDLQERELIKRALLTRALAQGLQRRGVAEAASNLAADVGMAVFYVGFGRWLADPAERECEEFVHAGFEELKVVASGR